MRPAASLLGCVSALITLAELRKYVPLVSEGQALQVILIASDFRWQSRSLYSHILNHDAWTFFVFSDCAHTSRRGACRDWFKSVISAAN